MADGMTANEVFHSHSSLTYDDLIIMPGFIDFGVQDVKYVQGKPATMSDIQAWEDANSPFKLPEDLKAFLLSSDGFKMTWDVLFKQEVHHLGNMHINSLAEIKKMPMMLVPHDDADDDDLLVVPPGSVWDPRREDDGARGPDGWKPPFPSAAFDLDSSVRHGRVALVFVPSFEAPPFKISSPAPPLSTSSPLPPSRVSSPLPPLSTSSPWPPFRTSSPAAPTINSSSI